MIHLLNIQLTFTEIFILSLIIFVLAVDFVLYLIKGEEGTITYAIRQDSRKWFLIPFFGGLLVGHFWWAGNCGI